MKITAIIPARFASSRFPGKPLVEIEGKSMIQRVYEQAMKCKSLNKVIVATDDDRIFNHVVSFGGEVVMTKTTHVSGTDRCAEVVEKIQDPGDVVLNIQGDEPFLDPEQIEVLCKLFSNEKVEIGTLCFSCDSEELLNDPNKVKVVFDSSHKALYFSRSNIPFLRNKEQSASRGFIHIGLYGFRSHLLPLLTKLPLGKLEQSESLEQLRWMEAGYSIHLSESQHSVFGIDTPADLEKAINLIRK